MSYSYVKILLFIPTSAFHPAIKRQLLNLTLLIQSHGQMLSLTLLILYLLNALSIPLCTNL